MPLLYPDLLKNRITDITLSDLQKLGVRGLLLDVDNTLTELGSQKLDPRVKLWLEEMKRHGIGLTVISNSFPERVRPFAARIGLRYICLAFKPFPLGFWRAARRLGLPVRECAAVGDQTFTDVIGSKIAGARAIQLLPIKMERRFTQRFKRRLESYILRRYHEKLRNR